jgi:hypothetical protein
MAMTTVAHSLGVSRLRAAWHQPTRGVRQLWALLQAERSSSFVPKLAQILA